MTIGERVEARGEGGGGFAEPSANQALGLRAGDWVEVKSREEILATLDHEGCLDALPFMPEMLQYCGRRFQVFRTAHKTCDTIKSWGHIRYMSDAVHLAGLRCDGEAHGKCQAACLLYWKEAWLRREPDPKAKTEGAKAPVAGATPGNGSQSCDLNVLQRSTRAPTEADGEERYRCQATDILRATKRGHWWNPRPYVRDLTSGNVSAADFVRFGLFEAFNHLRPYPYIRGRAGQKTPHGEPQNLQVGEWVEVRSKEEILATLNPKMRHRGLFFDVEMLPYCGKKFRILSRVERLVDDKTGRLIRPKNACFILEGAVCSGLRSRLRMYCPRSIYPYWHEIWLKRAEPVEGSTGASRP